MQEPDNQAEAEAATTVAGFGVLRRAASRKLR